MCAIDQLGLTRLVFAAVTRVLFNVASFGREVGIILGLYALWQLAGTFSLGHTDEAVQRGHWLWNHERAWHFPSEVAVQRPILGHPFIEQVANIYYATMHFGMLLAVLLWLYIRHRDAYRRTRTLIVLTTTACLLVALVPVAPPRLIDVGMVDTATAYGQSVYAAPGSSALINIRRCRRCMWRGHFWSRSPSSVRPAAGGGGSFCCTPSRPCTSSS